MRRILCTVEYDGTDYAGWQRQLNGLAVQQVLEEALARATGKPVAITGASRTDAGVNATGQRAHFHNYSTIPAEKFPFVLNTMLPPDIRIRESMLAPEGFHARFSACGKVYRYTFCNARHACAIGRQYKAHAPMPMDAERMHEEAQSLCGRHDFAAFAASGSVAKSTVRTIYRAQVERQGEDVVLTVLGDGFLYNMVRILAGTLCEAGAGRLAPEAVPGILASRDRKNAGPTLAAKGLFLKSVDYDTPIE